MATTVSITKVMTLNMTKRTVLNAKTKALELEIQISKPLSLIRLLISLDVILKETLVDKPSVT